MNDRYPSLSDAGDILIVDDSPTQAEQLRFMLEQHGFRITVAGNGLEALRVLAQHRPTLIISDILMPGMDGYDLCKAVNADANLKRIPVVLLTVLAEPPAVLKALESGASGFFTKPYEEENLLARIDYLLSNLELRRGSTPEAGLDVSFAGEHYRVTAERPQILDLLISTYETAVQKNLELIKTQDELRVLNETLEEKVRVRTADLLHAEASLRSANRALRTLSRCNVVLVRAADEATLLDQICQTITETAGYRLAWVCYADDDKARTVRIVAKAGVDAASMDALKFSGASDGAGKVPAVMAIQSGKSCAVADIRDAPASAWRDHALSRGYRSVVALPVQVDGHVVGALSIDAAEPNAFSEEEIELLAELGDDLGYGIGALRTRAAKEVADKELILAAKVFENSAEGIMITEADGSIVSVNRAFTDVTGYEAAEALGKNPRFLASGRYDRAFYQAMWTATEQIGHWAGEIWNRRKSGSLYPEWLDISAVRNEGGDIVNYVAVFRHCPQIT